jgi:hypothetical protein
MRSAFEGNPEDDPEYFPGMKDQCVLAAAQFIMWSDQEQFKRIRFSGDADEDLLRDWKRGPVYAGKAAFGLERWWFWRLAFGLRPGMNGFERRRWMWLIERPG